MQATIIGTGSMTKGIGTRFVDGKHKVTIHARTEDKGRELANHLNSLAPSAEVESVSIGSPVDDIVILAVPFTEIENVAKEYNCFDGKIVIDITNPVDFNTFQLIPESGISGAEQVSEFMPNAKIVKAFNTTLAGTLEAGQVDGKELDVFIAGDDQEAKDTVSELIRSSGMRPIDVGPLSNSRHLEGFGLIQMAVQDQIGTEWMSALKFIG